MLSEASLAQHEGHDLRREGRSERPWAPKERREVAGGRQETERGVGGWQHLQLYLQRLCYQILLATASGAHPHVRVAGMKKQ